MISELNWYKDCVKALSKEVEELKQINDAISSAVASAIQGYKVDDSWTYVSKTEKRCLNCKKVFEQPDWQDSWRWKRRKYCCRECGFNHTTGKSSSYTLFEEAVLRECFEEKGTRFVRLVLPHRSDSAIRKHATRMGLKAKGYGQKKPKVCFEDITIEA